MKKAPLSQLTEGEFQTSMRKLQGCGSLCDSTQCKLSDCLTKFAKDIEIKLMHTSQVPRVSTMSLKIKKN